MEKSDRHDQWNVLNLLTYNFGIKDNFEQGGIVPLNHLMQLTGNTALFSRKNGHRGGALDPE